MPEKIIIEGGRVTRVREDVISQVSLQEYLERTQSHVITPVLPHGTVMYQQSGEKVVLFIEHEPVRRNIKGTAAALIDVDGTRTGINRSEMVNFDLWMPYVVMALYLDIDQSGSQKRYYYRNMRIFFRSRQLLEEDLNFKVCALPNIFVDTSGVCMGDFMDNQVSSSLTDMYGMAHELFWNSRFNSDLRPAGRALEILGGGYESWSQLSKEQVLEAVNHEEWPIVKDVF